MITPFITRGQVAPEFIVRQYRITFTEAGTGSPRSTKWCNDIEEVNGSRWLREDGAKIVIRDWSPAGAVANIEAEMKASFLRSLGLTA